MCITTVFLFLQATLAAKSSKNDGLFYPQSCVEDWMILHPERMRATIL